MKVLLSIIVECILLVSLSGMLQAQLIIDPERIDIDIEMDGQREEFVNLYNESDHAIQWEAVKGNNDEGMEAWELLQILPVSELLDDYRIQGVIFANDHFYVVGAGDDSPQIYVLNREGEVEDQYNQPVEGDRYGMTDLTYDGELFYGAVGEAIYGLTLEGEVVQSFEGPIDPVSCLAWDPDTETIWAGATTSNFFSLNREGEIVTELDRNRLRVYGYACMPEDPDEKNLYVLAKNRENDEREVYKVDTESNEMEMVISLNPQDEANPEGSSITSEYIEGTWTYLTIANLPANDGGDRIEIWNILPGSTWLTIDPPEGELLSQDDIDVFLMFDVSGLEPQAYSDTVSFLSEDEDIEIRLPVSMTVLDPVFIVAPLEDVQIDEDWGWIEIADLDDHFADPDGAELTYTSRHAPENLNLHIDDENILSINPQFNYYTMVGVDITILAINPEGVESGDIFNLMINAVNDAPEVKKAIEDVSVNQNPGLFTVADLDTVFYDVDLDELIFYLEQTPDEIHANIISGNLLQFEPDPDYLNVEGIDITVYGEDPHGETGRDLFTLTINPLDAPQDDAELPGSFELSSVYPNPFNSATTINYTLPTEAQVTLGVYNLQGQLVEELVNSAMPAGMHTDVWDGGKTVTGVYFLRLTSSSETKLIKTKKLIIIK